MSDIAAALVKVQKEMPAIEPDATNPHFKSRFVSLDHLLAVALPVLNKHGIAVAQFPSFGPTGEPALTTRLLHEGGDQLESTMPLLLAKADPQGQGSALTYARRYALAAALGISSEKDDDGESATVRETAAPKPSAAERKELDTVIAQLALADPAKDWADSASKYCRREFGHGIPQLTRDENARTVAAMTTHLETLTTDNGATRREGET